MKFRWSLVFILFLIASCSGKKETSKTEFSVRLGALTGTASTHAQGGAMLYGTSASGKKFARRLVAGTELVMDLSIETWTFKGVMWDGADSTGTNGNFLGKSRCAVKRADLVEGEQEVVLNFNESNCLASSFQVSGTSTISKLPGLNVNSCRKLTDVSDAFSVCDSKEKGYFSSFQVLLIPYLDTEGVLVDRPENAIRSGCYRFSSRDNGRAVLANANTSASGLAASYPMNGGNVDFRTIVRAYYGSEDCNDTTTLGFKDYLFEKGLMGSALESKSFYDTSAENLSLYLTTSMAEVCQAPRNRTNNFAFGSTNTYWHGLCNASQFNLIQNVHLDKNFLLLSNLDFRNSINIPNPKGPVPACSELGESIIPIGGLLSDHSDCSSAPIQSESEVAGGSIYNGVLEGNNFKMISTMIEREEFAKLGLVRELGTAGEVVNLTIEKGNFNGGQYLGAIVGRNHGTVKNVKVIKTNVESRNKNQSGTVVDSYVGGIVGENLGTLERVQFIRGEVSGENSRIGGITGSNSGTILKSVADTYVNNDYFQNADTTQLYLGGVVGFNSGSVTEVVGRGYVSGSGPSVGGIAGKVQSGGTLRDAYSQAAVHISSNGANFSSYNLGGIVGFNEDANVSNVYFAGSVMHNCSANDTTCMIGEISGNNPANNAANAHAIYHSLANFGGNRGTEKTVAEMRDTNNILSTALGFDVSTPIWRHTLGDVPRLNFEDQNICEISLNTSSFSNQSVSGRGSADSPYIICRESQLVSMNTITGNFKLGEHVVLNGTYGGSVIGQLNGTLDGNDFLLHGAKINVASSGNPVGVIGQVNANAVLKKVNFANNLVSATTADATGIVGLNSGSIERVNVVSSLAQGQSNIGLLVGLNDTQGRITRVRTHGRVYGFNEVGGVVGLNRGQMSRIRSHAGFVSNASETNTFTNIGGIIGRNDSGSLTEASSEIHFNVNTQGTVTNIGGVVGQNFADITDVHVAHWADLRVGGNSVNSSIGGVVGNHATGATMNRVISYMSVVENHGDANLPGPASAGAIVGTSNGTINNAYFTKQASSSTNYFANVISTSDAIPGMSCNLQTNGTDPFSVPRSKITVQDGDSLVFDYAITDVLDSSTIEIAYSGQCSDFENKNLNIASVGLSMNPNIQMQGSWDAASAIGTPSVQWSRRNIISAGNYAVDGLAQWNLNDTLVLFVHSDGTTIEASRWTPFMQTQLSGSLGILATPLDLDLTNLASLSFDIVEDREGGSGFNRIVDAYLYELENGEFPDNAPKWRIDTDRAPELLLSW
ncbi:hypothetical protein HBN50_04485 [Halobacteriovorax sp. GB3]|uniref:GLUG motif-containing protein n=1 Tax=Halobacteriovorax sp. GB3 TaxID=2719615 RepID=UPI0023612207|nr:GLUG motif-containing protein [Halobacteriovorax sp. GB3]MDD0852340.1 hypothetical protein [Halobacteriovorax sp. GB3]